MEQQRTGGGPPQVPPLTTLEKRILKIMGNKAIYGDEIVPELGFGKVEILKNMETDAPSTSATRTPSTPLNVEINAASTSASLTPSVKRKLEYKSTHSERCYSGELNRRQLKYLKAVHVYYVFIS
ncbi:uncharacterized protein LOC115878031 [Sitophilus oryzae]|uniref:Uncharacterized protein LOC115878031 n=1 Tax=Sitophilus oryzae TaxID=7048 RepID=A0A6J2XGI7_SITOR|nr:uncharacterized protein LOC115878031 [Sitophilus oryzae]